MMEKTFDFHIHLLPDMDDGADFPEDALAMARLTMAEGISGVLLTPHYWERRYDNVRRKVLHRTWLLKQKLLQESISLEVFPAVEACLSRNLLKQLQDGKLTTINDKGRYQGLRRLAELAGEKQREAQRC